MLSHSTVDAASGRPLARLLGRVLLALVLTAAVVAHTSPAAADEDFWGTQCPGTVHC